MDRLRGPRNAAIVSILLDVAIVAAFLLLASGDGDGGFVVTNSNNPESVYIAYPDTDEQIEVYDPDPKTAFSLATSGAIVPIS